MTIIACRDGIMAADGLSMCNGVVLATNLKKIYWIEGRGSLVGCCGNSSCIARFMSRMASSSMDDNEIPGDLKIGESFGAIELRSDGKVWEWDNGLFAMDDVQEFYAIGSHFEFAMGAMAMGASAAEAVELTCEGTTRAGGDIQVRRISEHRLGG